MYTFQNTTAAPITLTYHHNGTTAYISSFNEEDQYEILLPAGCQIDSAVYCDQWSPVEGAINKISKVADFAADFRMNCKITRKGRKNEIKAICLAAAAAGYVGLNDAPRLKKRVDYLIFQNKLAARHPFHFYPFCDTQKPEGYIMPKSEEWIKTTKRN